LPTASRKLHSALHKFAPLRYLAPLTLTLTGTTTALADSAVNAADLCSMLNKRTSRVAVKAVAKPPYQRLYKEPAFGTRVMRISNSAIGSVTKPGSNATQAWNFDESRLMLHNYKANADHSVTLLDGHSFDVIGTLKLPLIANENVYWSQLDPNILFYMPNTEADAGKLIQINISTGERAVLTDFARYCNKRGLPAIGSVLKAHWRRHKMAGE